jgi:hypothetical protein
MFTVKNEISDLQRQLVSSPEKLKRVSWQFVLLTTTKKKLIYSFINSALLVNFCLQSIDDLSISISSEKENLSLEEKRALELNAKADVVMDGHKVRIVETLNRFEEL